VSRRLAIVLLRVMRLLLVPFQSQVSLTPRVCKYEPSCSCYGEEAIRRHGVVRGSALALWRVLRCNPWSKGGYDPVPGDERVTAQ
jgi:putative membrane protein insertion efficiency factor